MFIRQSLIAGLFLLIQTPVSAAENAVEAPGLIQPLLIGADAPDATLTQVDGTEISLKQFFGEKPTLLVFYRGYWCPYCQKQLAALEEGLQAIKDEVRILIISQDTPAQNQGVMTRNKLSFPILSDPDLEAAGKLGLLFKVDAETQKRYMEYGIDLIKLYGREQALMPTPAIFVVRNGKISFSYVNPDYRQRLSPEVIKAVIQNGN